MTLHPRLVNLVGTVAIGSLAMAACNNLNPTTPTPPSSGATLSSVTVSQVTAQADTLSLRAMAQFSDGSSQDVTQSATWSSSNAALATVSSPGVVKVFGSGEVDVRATYQSTTGSLHVLLTQSPFTTLTVSGGANTSSAFQMTATAHRADGSALDVSSQTVWSTSDATVATVSGTGLVTVLRSGSVEIRATFEGMTAAQSFAFAPAYAVTGVVRDSATSAVIIGASVRVLDSDIPNNPALTNADGTFTLPSVPAGTHLVEITKNGYQVKEMEIQIVNASIQITIALIPTPPGGSH